MCFFLLCEHFSHKSSILFTPKLFSCVLNLHKEITCFFSTIGDDGSRQYRSGTRVSFEFLKIRCCFCVMRNFSLEKQMFFSFDTLLRRKYVDTLLRRKYFDTLLRRNQARRVSSLAQYVRKSTCFFSTIGDDGSRQSRSYAAILAAVF